MILQFRNGCLYTQVVVIGKSQRQFEALVDTGSVKTGIPLEECRNLGLRASGAERTAGLYGEDYLPLFDCRLKINEKIFETQIIGLPIPIPIVGMDVLRNYRLIIDWKTQIGEAEET